MFNLLKINIFFVVLFGLSSFVYAIDLPVGGAIIAYPDRCVFVFNSKFYDFQQGRYDNGRKVCEAYLESEETMINAHRKNLGKNSGIHLPDLGKQVPSGMLCFLTSISENVECSLFNASMHWSFKVNTAGDGGCSFECIEAR